MAGVRRAATGRRVGVLALVLVAIGWPGPARATDGDVITLPGLTVLAHVADLDGDGVREVVRLVADEAWDPLAIEAWSHDGSGWRASSRLPIQRPADGGPGPMTAVSPAAMLSWRDGDREHLVLVTSGGLHPAGGVDRIELARISRRGAQLELVPLPADGGPVERIEAADVDGDGLDELIVTEPSATIDRPRTVRLLRWTGDRFASEPVTVSDGPYLSEPVIGESDEVPGDDLVFTRHDRPELYRFAPASSSAIERAMLPVDDASYPIWPVAVADGAVFVYVQSPLGTSFLRVEWPAGGEAEITVSEDGEDASGLQPMPAGDDVYFLGDPSFGPERDLTLRDARLVSVATVPVGAATAQMRRLLESGLEFTHRSLNPFPYSGPIPGGIDGSPAMLSAGHLIIAGDDGIEVRPTGTFTGVTPLGTVGPDDEWMALSQTVPFVWAAGYLHPSVPVENAVTIAPLTTALEPEANGGLLEVELRGASRIGSGDDAWVASADGGFEVVVHGMPGSRVAAVLANRVDQSMEIGPDGSVVLRLDPRPRRDTTVSYTAQVVLVAPTGHLYGTTWTGRVLREPPALEAAGATRTGAWEAAVSGRTDAHASVTVDGTPVAVDEDGAFRIMLDAGLVPRDVLVRASDPAGNETTQRLEVVGLVDYRGWPWVPIVGMATILFGAGMYLRAPRGRSLADVRRDEGTIEEIDAG